MPRPTINLTDKNQLRQAAEASLMQGTTPPTKGWAISPDALALLYRLASSPENASDALKLLHELQTHQVELDLQHEQLKANEEECAHQQERYQALFTRAPFAYFVLSMDGQIIEANQGGANLFGVMPAELLGNPIDSFLSPASKPILGELLASLRDDNVACCELQASDQAGNMQRLQVAANVEPGDGLVLLAILELRN